MCLKRIGVMPTSKLASRLGRPCTAKPASALSDSQSTPPPPPYPITGTTCCDACWSSPVGHRVSILYASWHVGQLSAPTGMSLACCAPARMSAAADFLSTLLLIAVALFARLCASTTIFGANVKAVHWYE